MFTGRWLTSLSLNDFHGNWRVDKSLHGTALGKLAGSQFLLRDEVDLMPYVEAIERADTATLNLARPQLFKALDEVRETLQTRRFNHERDNGLLDHQASAADIADTIVVQAAVEAARHLAKAEREPGNEAALLGVAAGLIILAEAKEIVAAMGGEKAFGADACSAEARFTELAAGAARLRGGVGTLHADKVLALVPDPVVAEAEAAESIRAALTRPVPDLGPHRLGEGLDLTGDWDTTRRMEREHLAERLAKTKADPKGTPEEAGSIKAAEKTLDYYEKRDQPLPAEQTEKMRTITAGVLADYDATFHRPGFVALLHQAAVMARDDATRAVNRETVPNVSIRAECDRERHRRDAERSGYFRNSDYHEREANRPIEEVERNIAARQANYLTTARRDLALAQSVETMLAQAARAVGVEPPVLVLTGEMVGDVLVFRADGTGTTVAVYPDPRPDTSYADAVYVSTLPSGTLDRGLPQLEDIRNTLPGTNFRNMEDFLASVRHPQMQEHLFGRPVAVTLPEGFAAAPPPKTNDWLLDDSIPF